MTRQYDSVEQRMANTYLEALPSFVPADDGPPHAEQRAFYELIGGLFLLAADEPALFVKETHPDDAYPNRFNKTSYQKPELIKQMRTFRKEVDLLLSALFSIGRGESVALRKRQAQILSRLGVSLDSPVLPALKWMAMRDGANIDTFSRCLFDPDYPYEEEIYAKLLGDTDAFRRLIGWLSGHGYSRFILSDTPASDDKHALTYANLAFHREPPRGGFEYGVKHTGVSMRHDYYAQNPAVLGLLIPGGMRPHLLRFAEMGETLQSFVMERARRCDGCGYCVQTDKTGKKPRACVPIEHGGATHSLCTYFPGFSYCVTALSGPIVERMISFLAFMDEQIETRK